jgi:putative DeoR family transcriptional regulator (stage III sporulation protein D)
MKNGKYESRCEMLADYMIKTQSTVRDTAYEFSISKSTVHKDITDRLKRRNITLFESVRVLLDKNKSERHKNEKRYFKTFYLIF